VARIHKFLTSKGNAEHFGQEASGLLTAFLVRLGTSPVSHKFNTSPAAKEYCGVVSEMMESVCENLTLADIAAKNNISVSYVKFLFQKYAGVSPKQYYTNLRVQHARALLCEGKSVAEVSDIMNFSSPNYFSTFFKKYTGVLPSEIKKNQQNG